MSDFVPLPPEAIDSHMHLYPAHIPSQPGGPPCPADFPDLTAYRQQVQGQLGCRRVVVVQANAHQKDNTPVLEALADLGDSARGVIAAGADLSDAEMERLTALGVRGCRIMNLGGAYRMPALTPVSERIAAFGWSCIVQFDGREIEDHVAALEKIPGPYVIDHIGKFLEPVPAGDARVDTLLRLIDRGNCYVKIAGCYEISRAGAPDYEDVGAVARRVMAHAPDRILWGSNWPHVMCPPDGRPDDRALLDVVRHWQPDEAAQRLMFVENPARLYGFA